MPEQEPLKLQLKTLARIANELGKLDEAGLRYVIDRSESRLRDLTSAVAVRT